MNTVTDRAFRHLESDLIPFMEKEIRYNSGRIGSMNILDSVKDLLEIVKSQQEEISKLRSEIVRIKRFSMAKH